MNRSITAAAALGLTLLVAPTARAQQTITAVGRVVDAQGNPIPDVQVLLDYKGHVVQKYRTKTDKRGVFTHVNVYSGDYLITLHKDGIGDTTFSTNLQALDSVQKPPDFRLVPKPAPATPPPGSGLVATNAPAAAPVDLGAITSEINAAIALSSAGDTEGAIAAYEAIVAKTPQIPLVQYNLGTLYRKKGETAKAQAALQKSIELDHRFVDGYVGLATLLAETGRRGEAVDALKRGAVENPASGRLQYALGVLAESQGETAAAKEAFLKAEQLDPQNAETQYHLATVALNQNDKAEAIARLQKFIAAAPAGAPSLDVARSLLGALQKKQ